MVFLKVGYSLNTVYLDILDSELFSTFSNVLLKKQTLSIMKLLLFV